MPRPLHHPRLLKSLNHIFSDRCQIRNNAAGYPVQSGALPLSCLYEADTSPLTGSRGVLAMLEVEAPSGDKLLVPRPLPDVKSSMIVTLTVYGKERWFEIADVLPAVRGLATLLILSPHRS